MRSAGSRGGAAVDRLGGPSVASACFDSDQSQTRLASVTAASTANMPTIPPPPQSTVTVATAATTAMTTPTTEAARTSAAR